LRMLCFPMCLFWLWVTNGLPLRASSNEARVWERAELQCLDRCGGGASWCSIGWGCGVGGTSGCERHAPTRNSVPTLSWPGAGGGGLLVTENSVIFSVRYAARSFMHKHIHMVRD
jgi:hypothetical protein